MQEVCSFLGHVGFYRRFIKDFSKVALPLSKLLQQELEFDFDDQCKEAFDYLNRVLTFEKCHFMVEQGIVLGHIISSRGIEVDLWSFCSMVLL